MLCPAESQLVDVAGEIAAAARRLAIHRLGAIILWDPALSVQDGVVLDAVVSRQLLVTIFTPESTNQLRVGAVFIRDRRIERAGVRLIWAEVVERAAELAAGIAFAVDEESGEIRTVKGTGHLNVVEVDDLDVALRRYHAS